MVFGGYSLVLNQCIKNDNDVLFLFHSDQEVGAEVLVKRLLLKKFENDYLFHWNI